MDRPKTFADEVISSFNSHDLISNPYPDTSRYLTENPCVTSFRREKRPWEVELDDGGMVVNAYGSGSGVVSLSGPVTAASLFNRDQDRIIGGSTLSGPLGTSRHGVVDIANPASTLYGGISSRAVLDLYGITGEVKDMNPSLFIESACGYTAHKEPWEIELQNGTVVVNDHCNHSGVIDLSKSITNEFMLDEGQIGLSSIFTTRPGVAETLRSASYCYSQIPDIGDSGLLLTTSTETVIRNAMYSGCGEFVTSMKPGQMALKRVGFDNHTMAISAGTLELSRSGASSCVIGLGSEIGGIAVPKLNLLSHDLYNGSGLKVSGLSATILAESACNPLYGASTEVDLSEMMLGQQAALSYRRTTLNETLFSTGRIEVLSGGGSNLLSSVIPKYAAVDGLNLTVGNASGYVTLFKEDRFRHGVLEIPVTGLSDIHNPFIADTLAGELVVSPYPGHARAAVSLSDLGLSAPGISRADYRGIETNWFHPAVATTPKQETIQNYLEVFKDQILAKMKCGGISTSMESSMTFTEENGKTVYNFNLNLFFSIVGNFNILGDGNTQNITLIES